MRILNTPPYTLGVRILTAFEIDTRQCHVGIQQGEYEDRELKKCMRQISTEGSCEKSC